MWVYFWQPDLTSLAYTTSFSKQPPSSWSGRRWVTFSVNPTIIWMVIGNRWAGDLNIYNSSWTDLLYSHTSFWSWSALWIKVWLPELIWHQSVTVELVSHWNVWYHEITFYYE